MEIRDFFYKFPFCINLGLGCRLKFCLEYKLVRPLPGVFIKLNYILEGTS